MLLAFFACGAPDEPNLEPTLAFEAPLYGDASLTASWLVRDQSVRLQSHGLNAPIKAFVGSWAPDPTCLFQETTCGELLNPRQVAPAGEADSWTWTVEGDEGSDLIAFQAVALDGESTPPVVRRMGAVDNIDANDALDLVDSVSTRVTLHDLWGGPEETVKLRALAGATLRLEFAGIKPQWVQVTLTNARGFPFDLNPDSSAVVPIDTAGDLSLKISSTQASNIGAWSLSVDWSPDYLQGVWSVDEDSDGWGVANLITLTTPTAGMTNVVGDCDDTNAMVHPAAEWDLCDDGLDNDCDGSASACHPDLSTDADVHDLAVALYPGYVSGWALPVSLAGTPTLTVGVSYGVQQFDPDSRGIVIGTEPPTVDEALTIPNEATTDFDGNGSVEWIGILSSSTYLFDAELPAQTAYALDIDSLALGSMTHVLGSQIAVAGDLLDEGHGNLLVAESDIIAIQADPLYGQPAITTAAAVVMDLPTAQPHASHDVDGDGVVDLFWSFPGGVGVMPGPLERVQSSIDSTLAILTSPFSTVESGSDLDGDGIMDLVVLNGTTATVASGSLVGLWNLDDFATRIEWAAGEVHYDLSLTGDLHADGWGDLAFASNDDDDGDVELYAGPLGGNVSPTSATHIRTASYAHVGPSSDFDGDGAPDLAISDAVGLHIVLGSAL